jgi:uncharacterized membrane protein YagU involved in acid resistance
VQPFDDSVYDFITTFDAAVFGVLISVIAFVILLPVFIRVKGKTAPAE